MPTTCDDTPVLRIANREQHYDYYACARHHDQLICAWHPDVPCRSMAQPLGQVTS